MDDGVRGDEAEIDTVEIDDVDYEDDDLDEGFHEVPIRCWDDLLRVTRSTTVEDVEDFMVGDLDSLVSIVEVTDDGVWFVLNDSGYGVVEPFPFTLAEAWRDLMGLEDDYQMPLYIEGFQETIVEVEDFDVYIEVDDAITDPKVLESLHRYTTVNGTLVQDIGKWRNYYARRAPGSMTVEEWLRTRFLRRLPGFRVSVYGRMSTTLRELRGPSGSRKLRSYGIVELERWERSRRRAGRATGGASGRSGR